VKTAIAAVTKAVGAVASAATAPPPATPAERAASAPPGKGFDEIRVPTPGGGNRHLTRTDFEALALPERVALLMGGKMQFFRQGQQVSARDALRSR
jgi:hypothetical protein